MKQILLMLFLLQPFAWREARGFEEQPASGPTRTGEDSGSILGRASALLDSRTDADRAWGAYLAGQNRLAELAPRLESILQETLKNPSNSAWLVRSILDAEIRMGTRMPESAINEIRSSFPGEATILFSRAPVEYSGSILSMFRAEEISPRWMALGNLLLEAKDPAFPLELMREMQRIRIHASLFDSGLSGMGGSYGWAISLPPVVPPEFPPMTLYAFRDRSDYVAFGSVPDQPVPAAVEVFRGPTEIDAVSIVFPPGSAYQIRGDGNKFTMPDRAEDPNPFRLRYLQAFLGLPDGGVSLSKYYRMVWNGSERLKDELRLHCNEIAGMYDRIASLLLERGIIAQSDAESLEIKISLRIQDFRKDKTDPLPDVKDLRPVVDEIEIGYRAYY